MSSLISTFTASDYDSLADTITMLDSAGDDIRIAENCGIDCQTRKAARDEQLRRLRNMQSQIFPSGRPAN